MGEAIRGLLDQLALSSHNSRNLLNREDIEAIKDSLPLLELNDSSLPLMLSGAPFAVASIDAFASWVNTKKKQDVTSRTTFFRYYFEMDGTSLAAKVHPFDMNNRNDPHCCVQISLKQSYNKRSRPNDPEDLQEEADTVDSSAVSVGCVSTNAPPSLLHYDSHSTDRELESGSESDYLRMAHDHRSPYSNESLFDLSQASGTSSGCVLVNSAVFEQLIDTVKNHEGRLGNVEDKQVVMEHDIENITARVQNLEMRIPIGTYGDWDTPF
eukprot:GILK01003843.1.p1 GENE.GILK01003843.1~~GILK01003843.1.p1  ORF type:complete len:268 (-),score=26.29 GILK01003843.1:280-1083(-)